MKNRLCFIAVVISLGITMTNVTSVFSSEENDTVNNTKIIATIPLAKTGVTSKIYQQVDRLVPKLKKLATKQIIRLDCRYMGIASREQDVLAAYHTAGKIEKYLRDQHKLKLDLWISAHIENKQKDSSSALIFSIITDDVNRLDSLAVNTDPAK